MAASRNPRNSRSTIGDRPASMGRSAAATGGGGNGSNARTVVIALAAVALGALVLAKGLPDSSGPGVSAGGTTATNATASATSSTIAATQTTPPPVATTPPAINPATSKVIVANGAQINGIAGTVSTKLTEKGYETVEPTNTSPVATSAVYAVAGSENIAQLVGKDLAIANVLPMPAAKPVTDLKGATVLVVIAPDFRTAGIPTTNFLKGGTVTPTTQAPAAAPAAAATPSSAVTVPT